MEERLTELYQGVAVHATADREHMAALELLALVMLADQHVGDDELDVLKELTEDWRGTAFSAEQYIGQAIATARNAWAHDTVTDLLDSVDARITSRVLRRALFSAARELVGVDDDVTPEEGTLLSEIAVRFGYRDPSARPVLATLCRSGHRLAVLAKSWPGRAPPRRPTAGPVPSRAE